MVAPPFPWFGGKQYLVKRLLPLLPPHDVYVEVFGGAGSLLLAKRPAPVEVYNDIDENLVNFYRVVRDEELYQRLQFLCALTPYSRAEFEESKRIYGHLRDISDPVVRAYWFFYNARCSFGGMPGERASFAYSRLVSRRGVSGRVSAYLSAVEGLEEVHERLRTVQVECLDWRDCMQRYECAEGLFYLDPPYHPDTRTADVYHHEFDAEDHKQLVDYLLGFSGMVLLSGYRHPEYERLERHGWRRWDFPTRMRVNSSIASGASRDFGRVESVWCNPLAVRGLNNREDAQNGSSLFR